MSTPAKVQTCEACGKKQGFVTIFGKVLCDDCFKIYLLKVLTGLASIVLLIIGFIHFKN
jgi:hypothetical protein